MQRKFQWILYGQDLVVKNNVAVEFDQFNRIISIEELRNDVKNKLLLSPTHFNAHVHAADIDLRGQLGNLSLSELVGPDGLKQRHLSKMNREETRTAILKSLREAKGFGVGGWSDFREGGLEGTKIYPISTEGEFHAFGRPEKVMDVFSFDALGIRDVLAANEEIKPSLQERKNIPLLIHVSEDKELRAQWIKEYGVSDVIWAIEELNPTALVHLTHADDEDISFMRRRNIPGIICLGSNLITRVGIPPIQKMIDAGIKLGIGTDNAMFQALSIWKEMRRVHKLGIEPYEIYKMATTGGATSCGVPWGITEGGGNSMVIHVERDIQNIFEWLVKNGDRRNIQKIYLSPTKS